MAISAKARKLAEAQAARDAELAAALAARTEAEASEPAPEEPSAPPTMGDQYLDIAQLIAKAKRLTKLSEPTLVKVWELNLQWVLNERHLAQQAAQQRSFPFGEVSGGGDEVSEADLPTPHEVITEVEETPSEESTND